MSGYISPQFHVLYDWKFQIAMGGYEGNESIATHIWESMVATNTENVTTQIYDNHSTIPNLHQDRFIQGK